LNNPRFLFKDILNLNELSADFSTETQIDHDNTSNIVANSIGLSHPKRAGSLQVFYSTNGADYTLIDTFNFSEGKTLFAFFNSENRRWWRITFDAETEFSVIKLGEYLELDNRNWSGVSPPPLSQKTTYLNEGGMKGQWLGKRKLSRRASANYNSNHLFLSDSRKIFGEDDNLFDLIEHLRKGGGVFFSWRPDSYINDAIYGYSSSAVTLSTGRIDFVNFSIVIDGIVNR